MRRAVVAILILVAVVVGGLVMAGRYVLNRGGAAAAVMLVQGADGNLALLDARDQLRPLTTDANGRHSLMHATPAPDGKRVAYVETTLGGGEAVSMLVVHAVSGERQTVFTTTNGQTAPFYLHWSPDSRHLAFLLTENNVMQLRNVATTGGAAVTVMRGNPNYFAWTPDGQRLLLHTNGPAPEGSMSVWTLGDAAPTKLATAPGYFQAPAWLPDGRSALAAVTQGDEVALARIGDDGAIQQTLATTGNGMVFVAAPDGKHVAYVDMTSGSDSHLHIVGTDGQGARTVSLEDVLSFVWAPDSRQVAYVSLATQADTPNAQGTVRRIGTQRQTQIKARWNVFNLETGTTRTFASFTPTAEFLYIMQFFDQFAQSVRLWNRTSDQLLYADDAGVWRADVATGATRKVADGVLGLWME